MQEKKKKKKNKIKTKASIKFNKINEKNLFNLVGVIMGSKSDWTGTMEHCSDTLKQFGIKHDVRVISAHRTPKKIT